MNRCTQMVSHMVPTILLALVKGLADWDTKCEILSKLKQMNLDETMAFVEAREIGKRDHSGRATASTGRRPAKLTTQHA
jgi:hypothetical protein